VVTALIIVMFVIKHSLATAVIENINAHTVVRAVVFEMFVTRHIVISPV